MLLRRVVHQDVETPETFYRLLHHVAAHAFIADVSRQQQTLASFGFHEPPGFVRVLVFVQVSYRDISAFAREQNRDRAADAAVAAGDQRRFARQLSAAAIFWQGHFRTRTHCVLPPGATFLLLLRKPFFHNSPLRPEKAPAPTLQLLPNVSITRGRAPPSLLHDARNWRSRRNCRWLRCHDR